MASEADCLTTGDMARLSKTTLRTVRFYEAEGLICAMTREGSSHRKFARAELRKLLLISDLRDAGLSLHEIKTLVGLKRRAGGPEAAALQMAAALKRRIDDLQERITTLSRVRAELSSTVAELQRCRRCRRPEYPEPCGDCEVTNRPECERATELLWKN